MALAAKDTAPRDLRHSGDLPTSTSAEGHSIDDPATGAVIDTVPEQGRDAVDAAVGSYLRGTGFAPSPVMHWAAGLHGDVTTRVAGLLQDKGIDLGACA